ncbi:MAG: hypothetical protein PHC60_07425 [Heliobacteriaceae bacterium]|nr:hypothetical protein [Heliobacteriaceae bacterium]
MVNVLSMGLSPDKLEAILKEAGLREGEIVSPAVVRQAVAKAIGANNEVLAERFSRLAVRLLNRELRKWDQNSY